MVVPPVAPTGNFVGSAGTVTRIADVTVRRPCDSADTVQGRQRAVTVSEWYSRRLTIHRIGSYTLPPLFALQYLAGREKFDKGDAAPQWAKTSHKVGAATIATVFTVNTVTGVWNLWDSRSVAAGRTLRYTHALSMLAADAGFTYAGVRLAEQAETSAIKRRQHRNLALASMGVSVASGVMMAVLNK